MLLKNFFAKINFKKFLRVRNPEIFENFFIKQQNSDVVFVGVFYVSKYGPKYGYKYGQKYGPKYGYKYGQSTHPPIWQTLPEKNGDFLIKPLIVFFKKYN